MAKQKPENRMLARIKPKFLADGFYVEKTNNPYLSGPPDWYLEKFPALTGWVEAKFWPRKTIPPVTVENMQYVEAMLSANQEAWLRRAQTNDVPAALLCGFINTKQYFFFEPWRYDSRYNGLYDLPQLIHTVNLWITKHDGD